jgi:hypothetical protein
VRVRKKNTKRRKRPKRNEGESFFQVRCEQGCRPFVYGAFKTLAWIHLHRTDHSPHINRRSRQLSSQRGNLHPQPEKLPHSSGYSLLHWKTCPRHHDTVHDIAKLLVARVLIEMTINHLRDRRRGGGCSRGTNHSGVDRRRKSYVGEQAGKQEKWARRPLLPRLENKKVGPRSDAC